MDWAKKTGDVSALVAGPTCSTRPHVADALAAARARDRPRSRRRRVAGGNHDQAVDHFVTALSAARNLGESLWIARVLADYAQALVRAGRTDEAEPLAAEAREAFEGMGAIRALARLDAGMPAGVTA